MNPRIAAGRTLLLTLLVVPLPVVLIAAVANPEVFIQAPGLGLGYILTWIGLRPAWRGAGRMSDVGASIVVAQLLLLAFLIGPPVLLVAVLPGLLLVATAMLRRAQAAVHVSPLPALDQA